MLVLLALSPSQIDPAHQTALTVFHEYQPKYASQGCENQDTGDLGGDSYFVLRGLLLPIECASNSSFYPKFDCNNPEQNSTDNLVSQLTLAVDSRFGEYASCDVNQSTGAYECTCGSWRHKTPCEAPVGRVDVAKRERAHHIPSFAPTWAYWRTNLAIKTGGYWFSTVKAGKCAGSHMTGGGPCTWKVVETKRTIVAACLETRIAQAVQKHDPSCFSKCAQPQNASSPCVAACYMKTILGPDAGSRLINATEGMPRQLLSTAWSSAFASADPSKGGCPDAPTEKAQASAVEGDWPMAWRTRAALRLAADP